MAKKDTVQSLKLENDKLKDKIQEICAELSNLRDESSRPIAIKNSTDLSGLAARLGSSGDANTSQEH